jgi:hypothetical protein
MQSQLLLAAQDFGGAPERTLVNLLVHASLPEDTATLHLAPTRVNKEMRKIFPG